MFKNYLLITCRSFLKYKTFTTINIAGLAIAFTCAILMYLFIHHELTFDQFHINKARIYRVASVEHNLSNGTEEYMVTQPYPLGPAMQEDLPEVESFVRLSYRKSLFIKKGTDIYQEDFILADSTLFTVFSFPINYGNVQYVLNKPNAVAISETAAKKYFGDSNPVGEILSIRLGQIFADYQVTAVFKDIPSNSSIKSDFFLSLIQENARKTYDFIDAPEYNPWHVSSFKTFVLLQEKASLSALEDKLPSLRAKYFPNEANTLRKWQKDKSEELSRGYYLQPLSDIHLNIAIVDMDAVPSKPIYSYILAGIACSILLLATINFTLLSVSRSNNRAKEVGIRKVVGARRSQLMQQFWGEAILTSLLSLLFALLLSKLALPLFNTLAKKELSFAALLEPVSLIALCLITLLTGLVAGFYPSLVLSGLNILSIFKSQLKLSYSGIIPKTLLTAQFVLPALFMIITAIMISQLLFMRQKELGFQSEQVLVIENKAINQQQVYQRFIQLAQQRTDIKAITATSAAFTKPTSIYFMSDKQETPPQSVWVYDVKPNFFDMLDIEFIQGRPFSEYMASDSTEAIIVNEALAKAFGWADPIDKKLGDYRVIGVVKDFHYQTIAHAIAPMAFYFNSNESNLNYIMVRLQSEDVMQSIDQLSALWKQVAVDLPFQYSFLDEDMQALYEDEARWTSILQWISGLSIFIACLGLIGVIRLTVANRTKEIGIRKVLGASVSSILLLLSKDYMKLILMALVIAIPVANYFMTEWLQTFAYRIEISWWLFTLPGLLVLAVVLITVSGQTLKAARQNPVDSLRYE